ncbi:MAG TPA: cytochrome P450 [Chloroflexota bacterium]|nr:cytochrome P450 [Chloroflexota bacterium]
MHEQSDPTIPEMTEDLDIHAPAFALDPFSASRRLREECPVAHSTRHGGFWLLTRYEDVRRAATDWRTYTSSVVGVTAIPIITQRTEPQLPIELDPPLHSRYRSLVNPVFYPERIEELRPTITALATELIDHLLERGEGDLVADYAVPLSVRTLAAFTGLPAADAHRWVGWIRRMFDVRDRADGARASQEFGAYIDELLVARRQNPTGDFISLLLESEVEGHRLTDKEVHSFCTVQFGAGFETTADAISVALYYLAEHPADRVRLFADLDLIPLAVEEFLRYVTPIQIFGRNATRAVELHGRTIGEGEIVALSFGSANHDPTVFPDPDRCVLDRAPNRHLAFGAGPHLCLGAPVARLEMAITLQAFAGRMPEFRVAPGRTATWKTRGDRRGLGELPVVLG